MDPVVHFELPAKDLKRMRKFYGKVFGWETEQMAPDMGDYVLATTTPVGKDGRPKAAGAINGGFFPLKGSGAAKHPMVVIGVADLRKTLKDLAKAGGKTDGEVMDIPGVGLYAIFVDTEGNRLSLMQPLMGSKKK